MKFPNLKDPNCRIYAVCSAIAAITILTTTMMCLAYLIGAAPSSFHELEEGEDPIGYATAILCTIVFVVCLVLVIRDFIRRMRGCSKEDVSDRYLKTSASHLAILFGTLSLISFGVIGLMSLIGSEVSESFTEDMTNYVLIASMMVAGPQEEGIFRLLLIGAPMLIICAIMHRAKVKDILGGFGMSKVAFILLVISSVLFGLAHIDGWGWSKFPDTFIAGMMFGYVYIEHGIHTTIVAHSAFDMMAAMDVFIDGIGTVPMIIVSVMGAIFIVRGLLNWRQFIPEKKIHEPFEGSLLEMWERE